VSLADAGIAALNLEKLTSSPLDLGREENQIVATSVFIRSDGSSGLLGDVALYAGDCGCGHDEEAPDTPLVIGVAFARYPDAFVPLLV
jgi:hypothetical protein